MKTIFMVLLLAGASCILNAADSSPFGPMLSYTVTCRPQEKEWVEMLFRLAMRHQSVSVAEKGDVNLWITVQPTGVSNTSTGYYHTGYAIGYVVTRPIPTNHIARAIDGVGSHNVFQHLTSENYGRMEFLEQGIQTCSPGDLGPTCESIVRQVDSSVISRERMLWELRKKDQEERDKLKRQPVKSPAQ